eukprot:TRINITY_DN12906_c0_g1_i1.p1 TRINITY_DN12906_c0_g1~~TRINITY_DN12906_c0_g1_i1.p1  ORF type:complete len:184 (+),score=33.88 TRINITY_DN12906_c0_g1_i1:83-634(+)
MLVLVIGDIHIPHRAFDLPASFKEQLSPERLQYILCTGNLCNKAVESYFRRLCPEVHIVKGDFDDNDNYPEEKVVEIGNFRIGLIHGHQIIPHGDLSMLDAFRRRLNVNVVVSGHTHALEINSNEKALFVNPGSATGAFSPTNPTVTPSFVLLDILEDSIIPYSYTISPNGESDFETLETFHL